MRFQLDSLRLDVRRGVEVLPFSDFTYFWGRMGAGKSSIPRLIDYCLGGDPEAMETPALQSEFVSATLFLKVNSHRLEIERQRDANQVRVAFEKDGPIDAILPLRSGGGEVIPGTGVEVLSDLIFYLADLTPPRVRKSRSNEDSDIERLSLRELLWYCYLVQEELDSSFFHLDRGAHFAKRYQSRNVLRYVLGFHQDRVTELEIELEEVRSEKEALLSGVAALEKALESTGLNSEEKIAAQEKKIAKAIEQAELRIADIRENGEREKTHAVESLREQGRRAAEELAALEHALADLEKSQADDERHLNELVGLKFKFRRVASARAVLEGVEFEFCPRCSTSLPAREAQCCNVCGQPDDPPTAESFLDIDEIDKDTDARVKELTDVLKRKDAELKNLKRRKERVALIKDTIDSEYGRSLSQYDSRYLSQALSIERQKAKLENARLELKKWRIIPDTVAANRRKANDLQNREHEIRAELRIARSGAEQDLGNLRRLADLFLDCLVRTRLPAFTPRDSVLIPPQNFLPQVTSPDTEGLVVANYANLGSGGIKTLFKCCFAVAVHRLATEISAPLPTLLIIDSPMKNISRQENPEQFAGFYRMLYELSGNELGDTQIIVVDNDFYSPDAETDVMVLSRHMVPYEDGKAPDPDSLPLISYYKGH